MKLLFLYPEDRLNLHFTLPTAEYERIWSQHSDRIQQSFEKYTGLKFQQNEIRVKVHDGTSMSGTLTTPMLLNALNYTLSEKQSALIHELGHRLLGGNGIGSQIEDEKSCIEEEHTCLYLFECDVLKDLYGEDVYAERIARLKVADAQAYQSVEGLSFEERQAKLQRLIAMDEPW